MDSIHPPPYSLTLVNPSVPAKVNLTENATLVLREQAKDALRSLVPHNIKYNQLVEEGVDPYLLRRLYEDLDVNFVQAMPSSHVAEVNRISHAQNNTLHSPQPAPELPNRTALDSSHDAGQDLQRAIGTKDIGLDLPPISSVPRPMSNAPGTSKAPISATLYTEKVPIAPPSLIVAMERKDRIAQLLAAKTGKAVPPRLAPEKQSDISIDSPKPDSPVETVKKPLPLPVKPPLPSPEILVNPKNKAQTELIRQKMEALKKEAQTKVQAQATTKPASAASESVSQDPATLSSAAEPQLSGSPEHATEVRSTELASQIPGLFMINLAHPNDPHSTNGKNDHPLVDTFDDPVSISSTSTSVSQDISAEFENNSMQSPGGHTPPVRLPRKRPLASDSFDEPMPRLKRPFGRKDSYDKVEIVVSEAASEGEVEEVEMELDEESDDEKQAHHDDVVSGVSVRESNTRNLPPLTDIPSPHSMVHSTIVVNTPASTAAQTPGKEKDKEELWKAKNQEIEIMRKKIAEMEERRKAKHNATHANSSKTGGKAAVPVIRTSLTKLPQTSSPGLARPAASTNAEVLRDALQSPVLTPSRPEELPSTPSTPLYAIKEPIKAENLRQKLLKKNTREGTPSLADIELRQAQLAEKRVRLAELKREAERREAEIAEDAKMLEAQLQAELNGEVDHEDEPVSSNSDVEGGSIVGKQAASDALSPKNTDTQGTDARGVPGAAKADLLSQPELSPVKLALRGSLSDRDTVLQPSNKDSVVRDLAGFERTPPSEPGREHAFTHELPGDTFSTPTDRHVEVATLPALNSPAALVHETGQMEVRSSLPLSQDPVARDAGPDIVESNLPDADGSVSMCDSVSEDYEPAEPDQVDHDQPENESEFYEPTDMPVPADTVQLSSSNQDNVVKPIEIDQSITEGLPQSISPSTAELDHPMLTDDAEDGMQLTEPDVINTSQMISQSHENETNDKVRKGTSAPLQLT